jgi:putative FmdB family regulatory protein
MPIYEYRCKQCGAEFEELTLSRDEGSVTCRSCSSRRVTRLLSTFAVGAQTAAPPRREAQSPCGACSAAQRGMCGVE